MIIIAMIFLAHRGMLASSPWRGKNLSLRENKEKFGNREMFNYFDTLKKSLNNDV
jgi:hypothetical protein